MRLKYIICHYNEIGLKGDNRHYFEKLLAENIRQALTRESPGGFESVKIVSGRILVILNRKSEKQIRKIESALKNTFGLAYFSLAVESLPAIEQLKTDAWEFIGNKKFSTFRVTTQRSDKNFPLNSMEINAEIGAYLAQKTGKKVKLNNPGLNCFVELANGQAFIYTKKIKGPGGLPVGASGRTAVLLSGGIDSPVAAYRVLKRGCSVIFIHFHSKPFTSNESVEKVKALAGELKKFNAGGKIFMVPFADAQKEVVYRTPEKLRVVLYRRLMLRIAEKIARRERCLALATGDSLGQVASQTLENMAAVEAVSGLPVLRPLVGFDKEEIIEVAKRIGTYDISIRPHDDCCVRFIPKHPETKADLKQVETAEEKLDLSSMIENALENTETVRVSPFDSA
ncbi:tRNA 4-thiouridine(8) synthase ThiI [Candidatus Falkowbacteria bacterium RIFOXYB2_FULL_47_14]|uniref:Probable tRNA sulfurtransferase n=1 Tax=Candidatus Falkowbacteria bacterium RIFOXYA2_FULL_47_19 TaxID=1797994 RepID=A0A1F5SEY2_9BACT|nr:MAG: tRNA 4-thiouridine(8) synthase ThiI [Candidatus Falkowbacteria bacterium RIFOXYA2_FULL_47_19]OGF35193.1 MAG: tRNA 4-thiouridine(8) synthase ThiI [Candidatus Falkowbacteria bacterium RIFOXYC2_FULL_46_15]OGF43358.1 MAG: tRNA 4-thiouridine(8) synthase ThiI [Candidatus Falkowbacteria bacterium RIFOXYB2_FULL_47_14]